MKKSFVSIGHITCDTEPTSHVGGSVVYSAVTAHRLGYEAHIITKSPSNHPFVLDLKQMGIHVHVLASKLNTITTFKNTYTPTGRRKQILLEKQEQITQLDIDSLPVSLFDNSIVLLASVIGEIDQKVFQTLANYKFAFTPQGYFRHVNSDCTITQVSWGNASEFVKYEIAIFSKEDITINAKKDKRLLEGIVNHTPITVLTEGEKGACVFEKNSSFHVNAFSLHPFEIKDFTGAGDTFATQFLLEYISSQNLKNAAQEACLFAAIKIMGLNGIGIDSIPTKEEVESFKKAHAERIEKWLANKQ